MGNQIAAVASSQILPVEVYLANVDLNLIYENNMGSTRFLKVAKARSKEGSVVVKVFVRHDLSIKLDLHKEKLDLIKGALCSAPNCLPFQLSIINDKAGFVVREYVRHSLYDRISTRPFLSIIEKKWITFQILCALHQCHKQKVCHGDIKLENILVTSWNWVMLADFASYKPVYLPDDNPADYNYFFDTSRRRICYIAPERFVSSMGNQKEMNSTNDLELCYFSALTPEMDIFSTGCALLELWTDGIVPFDYAQLLSYKSGSDEVIIKHLNNLTNDNLRNLISSMVSREPKDRNSAEVYLSDERDKFFPEYFYSFLQLFFQMIATKSFDEKINILYPDIKQIVGILSEKQRVKAENGTILIISVVVSSIRGLKRCSTKLQALEIIMIIAEGSTTEIILDRILPYVLFLTNDATSKVRVSALSTLTGCVALINSLPRSDINIFPEYIFPSIAHLAEDKTTTVRVAYAKHISTLAKHALQFLNQWHRDYPKEMTTQKYEFELHALHEVLQNAVINLLTDQQSVVKQTLVESGITNVCIFFGRQKANDVILSHMITFLNDKEDKNLRGAFFDNIVAVACFIGLHCSSILVPLLEQGLTDPEEFVVSKAVKAMSTLTKLNLMQKSTLIEYIKDCSCYLVHPNVWIRHEVCGLISVAACKLTPLDVQCKLLPLITNYLYNQLIQIDRPELLLDSLQKPIPRTIYNTVIRYNEIENFFKFIKQKHQTKQDSIDPMNDNIGNLVSFIKRLTHEGYNDTIELQLLAMCKFIIKIHKYKHANDFRLVDGGINLDENTNGCHEVLLSIANIQQETESYLNPNTSTIEQFMLPSHFHQEPSSVFFDVHGVPCNKGSLEYQSCKNKLTDLISNVKKQFSSSLKDSLQQLTLSNISPQWRLKGQNVAHLHEHKLSVKKLVTLKPFSNVLLSVSEDNSIRLWDCNKLNGQHSINRSKQTYAQKYSIYSIAPCENGKSIAVAAQNGEMFLLKVDLSSSNLVKTLCKDFDESQDGVVIDMMPLDQESQNVIVYCTLYGGVIGWDIRMQGEAWRFNNAIHKGVTTTMCVDVNSSWIASASSSGWHSFFDIRFGLPIHGTSGIKHPNDARIRKILCHPYEPWLISASQKNNEVISWNIETLQRQTAFYASSSGCSNSNPSSNSIYAMATGVNNGEAFLMTAGTDHRIRHWSFSDENECYVPVPSANDAATTPSFSYESRLLDGAKVIQEMESKPNTIKSVEDMNKSLTELPNHGHVDTITDLLFCKSNDDIYLVSSSRDGVIKLWK